MDRTDTRNRTASPLRQVAEAQVQGSGAPGREPLAQGPPEQMRAVLQELQVHQVELELQNEELRRAQVDLDALRARYFDLYDLAPVGYCTLSAQGSIEEANLTAATLLGVVRNELVGQPLSRFIVPEDQDIYYHHRRRLLATDEPQACTVRMWRVSTDPIWIRLEAVMARERDQAQPVCRVVLSDISALKQGEEEQQRLQDQLLQARKMESVGRLAGGVAHDFNNMLSIILGYVEMVQERLDPGSSLFSDLEEVHKAAERSAALTRQLLTFARKQIVSPEVLDLNTAMAGMLSMLERLIGENIKLVWAATPDLWPVRIDPSQVDQILANLCLNARDAIAGVGTVSVAARNVVISPADCVRQPHFAQGDYVSLAVSDTGCGMDHEMLANLFEPFFTTKKTGKGTGLGLATIYGIVKQNDGFIDVASEPGRGSTFTVYLPRHCRQEKSADRECLAMPVAAGGHETILLVEDEAAILDMAANLLRRQGYTVLAAATPGEALGLADTCARTIDLLLTDVIMPEMNGRDLARRLLDRQPGLRQLYMSGYTADVIGSHGVQDGGLNFIAKPFTMKNLARKVRAVLEQ